MEELQLALDDLTDIQRLLKATEELNEQIRLLMASDHTRGCVPSQPPEAKARGAI